MLWIYSMFVALILVVFFACSCSPCNEGSPVCDACKQGCIDASDRAACERESCSDVCSSCREDEEN